ncbi:hypothetical protein [Coleofasciculus chthonoplastes]|uniref:hypothetical protein n=1 Tax=Coleofasciculus chthonoplastes TaxID=64178 RepID=UPI0033013343
MYDHDFEQAIAMTLATKRLTFEEYLTYSDGTNTLPYFRLLPFRHKTMELKSSTDKDFSH